MKNFSASPGYKWEVLALLWVAFFINQADRQIFNVVLPLIREDLQLTDVQIGTIATIFNLVFAFLVPISGYAGDRFSRKWIVVFSILFWSAATMATGLANGVIMLILFRSVATGGGEALFGPANYALLASYHKETRAFAMSVHQTSYYVGIIASGILAGYVGERWGWKNAFYFFGAVGVLHGVVLVFRLKDPAPTGPTPAATGRVDFWSSLKILFSVPTAVLLTLAFGGLVFVLVGYLTWSPTYLYEEFGMSLAEAGFHSMLYTHVFAFAGVLIAGRLSDRLARKRPARRLLLQAAGLLGAIPFILLVGTAKLVLIYIGFAGFGFARAFFDANTYSVLYDVIPPEYHSSASGVMMMTGFAVGSLSPVVLGYLKPVIGLSTGFSLLAIVWFICGILLLIAYKSFFDKDYKRNHQVQ